MAFSQFCGILLASFVFFSIYCIRQQGGITVFFLCYIYVRTMAKNSLTFRCSPMTKGFRGIDPFVNKPLIGPSFACGMVWAFAQIGWFYANQNLEMSISFPIITTAPGVSCLRLLRLKLSFGKQKLCSFLPSVIPLKQQGCFPVFFL